MTREKAVKIIKEFINGTCLHTVDQEALETLIPELAESESEDERIRKALIDLVSTVGEYYLKPDSRNKMLAYLEKQKEEEGYEAIPIESTLEYKAGKHAGFLEGLNEGRKQKATENTSASTMIPSGWVKDPDKCPEFCVRSHCLGCPNYEQKEQKYIGFSKADKLFLQDVAEVLGDNEYLDAAKRLRDLSESLYLQPKQEWSEEDEHRRTDAIYFLETAKSHYADTSELDLTIAWLKSLPLNLKKKNEDAAKLCSNELSEEDKKLIDDVINSLCCYQNTLSDYQKEIVGEEIRKLKFLKPQPKQEWSDEDEDKLERVDCLLWLLDDYIADDCSMPQGKTDTMRDEIQNTLSPWLKNLRPANGTDCLTEKDKKMAENLMARLHKIQFNNSRTDSTSLNEWFQEEIEWLRKIMTMCGK